MKTNKKENCNCKTEEKISKRLNKANYINICEYCIENLSKAEVTKVYNSTRFTHFIYIEGCLYNRYSISGKWYLNKGFKDVEYNELIEKNELNKLKKDDDNSVGRFFPVISKNKVTFEISNYEILDKIINEN